jgi:ABC-type transport system involved in multi-copper enzyme maturation permease subunit
MIMYRTLVILRHTFLESILQPIYPLLLSLAGAVLVVFAALPFFTLGEDTVMYKDVGLDIVLLAVLIVTLFATSRSIFEEIEDRTMLTLMSKPVAKWEVLVGKYLGIIAAALLGVVIVGGILLLCTWWRIPGDYMLNPNSIDDREINIIREWRMMHLAGLIPSLLLAWMQISVLAAVSVAISTRVPLVVNLPVVILLYIAGNLTRFLSGAVADHGPIARGTAWTISNVLPYLETFDLRDKTVYSRIALEGTQFANDANAVQLATIWASTGTAVAYAAAYALFALSLGMLLFQTRELGGGEG